MFTNRSCDFLFGGWGGRVSDKEITLSSFLNYIEMGDQVLADRGFTIREEIAAVGGIFEILHLLNIRNNYLLVKLMGAVRLQMCEYILNVL